ncbi:MAG: hypothetical protein A3I05_09765 [Deltaproteobacteria bacterium RIFCSPLOWO2_02_FULL_44_10]|nr:MAG: hypothetical protein A3C46_09420 [Deltaproteobacteria bacterium RIFCSPHIGHO2_02_FULL_44_16]OGQ44981.1 MAG: hypothetical protein A3I05_09765 [Deltaproteobacteria bacterium RIFCSPLOWO2_02_FULL_44_10]
MAMLKLEKDDPKKELEFDVKCSLTFTQAQRIRKLLELSQRMLKLAKKYEDRKPYQILKRK